MKGDKERIEEDRGEERTEEGKGQKRQKQTKRGAKWREGNRREEIYA